MFQYETVSKPHSGTVTGRFRAADSPGSQTQAELAAIAGVGTRFVSELERGKERALLGLALELAQLLGVDLFVRPRSKG
tara:strand:+ start:2515 stop:2751 length:237 start_codon:yes stop_codon:yes gene_type:complete